MPNPSQGLWTKALFPPPSPHPISALPIPVNAIDRRIWHDEAHSSLWIPKIWNICLNVLCRSFASFVSFWWAFPSNCRSPGVHKRSAELANLFVNGKSWLGEGPLHAQIWECFCGVIWHVEMSVLLLSVCCSLSNYLSLQFIKTKFAVLWLNNRGGG